jgi:aminoglycoside phosphotransferase (APT) family kinase protein
LTSKRPTEPGTPQAEVDIDEALLRHLLAEQMPEFAELPITLLDMGWDNVSFRLGTTRVVRMPRREVAVPLLESEQRWLPLLAPRLPIDVPAPIAVGEPGHGYPWPWSLLPWIPGQSADLDAPAPDQAERFADFLNALHRPAPEDAPHNSYRGVPLADRAAATIERMDRLRRKTNQITPEVDDAWRAALATPFPSKSTWLHGDLHARNVLVDEGSFTGIIDWGDMTSGDGSTDLAATWMLFDDARARRRVLDAYDASETMRLRALGWAVFFGVVLLDTGLVDHPRHAAMGEATLRRVTEDG